MTVYFLERTGWTNERPEFIDVYVSVESAVSDIKRRYELVGDGLTVTWAPLELKYPTDKNPRQFVLKGEFEERMIRHTETFEITAHEVHQ